MKAWVGCVVLLLVFPVLASAGLIVNGGFETGNLTGWTLSGNTGFTGVAAADAHSGSYGAHFGQVGSLGYLSQLISTVPGDWYETRLWLRNEGGTPSEFLYNWDAAVLIDLVNPAGFGWTEYVVQAQATGSSTQVMFGFQQNPAYFHFDDVDVNRVPEPASLALIGLGLSALALVRRKRA